MGSATGSSASILHRQLACLIAVTWLRECLQTLSFMITRLCISPNQTKRMTSQVAIGEEFVKQRDTITPWSMARSLLKARIALEPPLADCCAMVLLHHRR